MNETPTDANVITERWVRTPPPQHDSEVYLIASHPRLPIWVSFGKDDQMTFWMLKDSLRSDRKESCLPLRVVSIKQDSMLVESSRQVEWIPCDGINETQFNDGSPASILVGTMDGKISLITPQGASQTVAAFVVSRFVNENIIGIWLARTADYMLVRTNRQMYLLELNENLQVISKTVLEELTVETRGNFEIIWHPNKNAFMTIVDGGNPKAWEVLKQEDRIVVLPHGALGDSFYFSSTLKKSRLMNGIIVTNQNKELKVLHWGTHTIESRPVIFSTTLNDKLQEVFESPNFVQLQELSDNQCVAIVNEESRSILMLFNVNMFNGKIELSLKSIRMLPSTLIRDSPAVEAIHGAHCLLLGDADGSIHAIPLEEAMSNWKAEDEILLETLPLWTITLYPRFHDPQHVLISLDGNWVTIKERDRVLLMPTSQVTRSQHADGWQRLSSRYADGTSVQYLCKWSYTIFQSSVNQELSLAWHPSGKTFVIALGNHMFLMSLPREVTSGMKKIPWNVPIPRVHAHQPLEATTREMAFTYTGELLFVSHPSKVSVWSMDAEQPSEFNELLTFKFKKEIQCISWHDNAHLFAVLLKGDTIQVLGLSLSKKRFDKLDEFHIRAEWFVSPLVQLRWHPTDLVLVGCDARGNMLTWRWNANKNHLEFLGCSSEQVHPKLGIHFQVIGDSSRFQREVRVFGLAFKEPGMFLKPRLVSFLLMPQGLIPAKIDTLYKYFNEPPISACLNPHGYKDFFILTSTRIVVFQVQYAGKVIPVGNLSVSPLKVIACAVRSGEPLLRASAAENGHLYLHELDLRGDKAIEQVVDEVSLDFLRNNFHRQDGIIRLSWHPTKPLLYLIDGKKVIIWEVFSTRTLHGKHSWMLEELGRHEFSNQVRQVTWHPSRLLAFVVTIDGKIEILAIPELDSSKLSSLQEQCKEHQFKSIQFLDESTIIGLTKDDMLVQGTFGQNHAEADHSSHVLEVTWQPLHPSGDGDEQGVFPNSKIQDWLMDHENGQKILILSVPRSLYLVKLENNRLFSEIILDDVFFEHVLVVKGRITKTSETILLAMLTQNRMFQVVSVDATGEVIMIHKEKISRLNARLLDFQFLGDHRIWLSAGDWSKVVDVAFESF